MPNLSSWMFMACDCYTDNPGTHGYQLVIPKMGRLQELLLTELHYSDLSGHLGIYKMLYALAYCV